MIMTQLKIFRTQNNLTQQQIADVLGITRSAYNKYEKGFRTPNIDTIKKLSGFYKVSVSELVDLTTPECVCDDSDFDGFGTAKYLSQLSKEELDLIVNFRIADDKLKQEILEFAKNNRKSK